MDRLHPLLVHLPIGIILLWPWIDTAGLALRRPDVSWTAAGLLLLALPAALLATTSGQAAYDAAVAAGVKPELLDTHGDVGSVVPWIVLALIVVRFFGAARFGRRAHVAAIALGFVLAALIVQVGRTGGALVLDHAIGVLHR